MKKPTKKDINAGHFHEMMDRSTMMDGIIERELIGHVLCQYIGEDAKAVQLLTEACEKLGEAYQEFGRLGAMWDGKR